MEINLERLKTDSISAELLAKKWKQLEILSDDVSFFTSWNWIGCWLDKVTKPTWLLEVKERDEVVALAVFVEKSTGLWPLSKKQLWLNKTGVHELDQIWIEYNDILHHKCLSPDQVNTIWLRLYELAGQQFQDIHVDVTKHQRPQQFCGHDKAMTKGYVKDISHSDRDILSQLSRNTRQQINRSKRLLQAKGNLQLVVSDGLQSRQQLLQLTSKKHQMQWRKTEWGSGFDNPVFCHFHDELVKQNNTFLLKLSVDDSDLAYGYYFYLGETVYFYLSAIEKERDNKIKIGLVFHVMAMEHFQQMGFTRYDFLGGDARYKASLSDTCYPLYSWCLSRDNWRCKTERFLRRARASFDAFLSRKST